MNKLPNSLYRCSQVKALDKTAIEVMPITGFKLMTRAAKSAFDLVTRCWPNTNQLMVFCGAGNNGGDGYVLAGLAHEAGFETKVYYLSDPLNLKGDAKLAFEYAKHCGVDIEEYLPSAVVAKGLVVDAMLGIGLVGDVRKNYVHAIDHINCSGLPVLALDIPSGICGDTGRVLGRAIDASHTISFIGLKRGLLTGDARNYVGKLSFADLGVNESILNTQKASCSVLQYAAPILPKRNINAHKGMFGRVLVVAGDNGYGGAGIMAAESALLCGSGIVELATRPHHVAAALARRPELIVRSEEQASHHKSSLTSASVIVVGPGLGDSTWSQEWFDLCLNCDVPKVIDADGLNILSEIEDVNARENWVLTPHPGEAARLLNSSTNKIQSNRFEAARALQKKYGGVVVLKGAGSIVADNEGLHVCNAGNPAMSTPGMGDVLSGVIGGMLAHDMSLADAAKLGVWAHATAADVAVEKGVKNLLATDIYSELRTLL